MPDNSVDKSQPGFLIRPYRTIETQPGTLAWTELQLAGFKGPNVVEATDAQNGWFTNETTINYGSVPGTGAGRFSTENGFPDTPFPGLAATLDGMADNLTEEILTWVEFPAAGHYTMGVRCKDGFKVTVGEDPRDQFAQVLGQSEQLRPSEDTFFLFSVSQPGIYPLRLLWMNSVGAADLEWFTVQSNGTYTLLNDSTAPGALKSYRAGPQGPAYISTLSPNINERDVQPGGCILVQVTDGATTFDAGAAMMIVEVDGMGVAWGSSSKSGNLTTSSNSWPGLLAPGSTNQATLYMLGIRSRSWQFVMANYGAATPTVTTATNAVWLDANSSITVSYSVYAPDLPLPLSAIAVTSSNPDFVPNPALRLLPPGSEIPAGTTGQVDVVIAPAVNAWGVATLAFTVKDGQYFVQNLLTVNVRSNTNASPLVATATNQVFVDENSAVAINYEVTDPDSTLTIANFHAISSDPAIVPNTSVNLTLASGTISAGATNTVSLTVTPALDAQGDVTLFFVVNDHFNIVTNTVTLTVRPASHPLVRPTEGWLAWWPGDENANDVFGLNNGRLNGGAGFAGGILGLAFDFSGTNDYLELPNCLSAAFATYSFTLEGWVYPTGDSLPEMSLAACGDESSPRNFKLELVKGLSDEYVLRLLLLNPTNSVIDTGTNLVPFVLQGTAPIPQNDWTHVAVTLGGWTGFSIYVNGSLDATGQQGPFDLNLFGVTAPWRLGSSVDLPYFGRIDEFSFYRRPLAQSEIAGIYATSRRGVPLPPVIVSAPQNLNAGIGADATFTVSAGSPGGLPLYYQWQFSGRDLPGETNATLVLHQVQPERSGAYSVVVSNTAGSVTSLPSALAVAGLVGWSDPEARMHFDVPAGLRDVVAISAGGAHCLVLKADGTVVAWGDNEQHELEVPPDLRNVTAIAAGGTYSLALKSDGTVVGWGGISRQLNWMPAGLSDVVAIAAGDRDSLALKRDGSLVIWDWNTRRPTPPREATNLVAIAGGALHDLALRADGTVVAWGDNEYGQTNVPNDLTNAVAVSAGFYHSLALRADGTVAAWGGGDWFYGLTNVPANLSNVVAIAAGQFCSLALRADGTVVEWTVYGNNGVPPNPTNFSLNLPNTVAISANGSALALLRDGAPQMTVQPWDQSVREGGTPSFNGKSVGQQSMNYQWQFNGAAIPGATKEAYVIANAQPSDEGFYSLVASNKLGNAVSRAARLSVVAVSPVNTNPPGITLSPTVALYVVGAPPMLVDTNAVFSGNLALDGALLSIRVVTNSAAADTLGVRTEGADPGQISVSGSTIAYGGTNFGTVSGGDGANALQVLLNTNASEAAVTALIRHLTFGTTSTNTDRRVIQVALGNDLTNAVATRQLILNRPPVVGDDEIVAAEGVTLSIPFDQLLANDFDLDADQLSVVWFTSNSVHGAQLTANAGGLSLTPAPGYVAEDTFLYAVQDARGGYGQGAVSVRWLKQNVLRLDGSMVTGSGAALMMGGIPGGSYEIQVSTNLQDWSLLSNVTATATGIVELKDADFRYPQRFYRAVAR